MSGDGGAAPPRANTEAEAARKDLFSFTLKLPRRWRLRLIAEREPRPLIWKFGCKHGLPNFVHCPECDA